VIEYDNYGLNKREGKRGTAHYYNINKAEKKPASQHPHIKVHKQTAKLHTYKIQHVSNPQDFMPLVGINYSTNTDVI
jgi:hypothetical protein